MAFLNNRVTPEPVPASAEEVGTELSDSLGSVKDKDLLINNSERVSFETNDHGGANECQEGLDGIPENDVVKNSANMLQNGKRSCSPHSQRIDSWNPEENISSRRSPACDRILLLAMCIMSAAALMLTLLMMFGVVGPMQCSCSGKPETSELQKNVQALERNLSAIRDYSVSGDIKGLEEKMKKDMENMKKEVSADLEKLETKMKKNLENVNNQDNKTELENIRFSVKNAVHTLIGLNVSVNEKFQQFQQKIMQLDQKVTNINTSTTIIGPPGFNGTDGDIGPAGPSGPGGLPGYNGTQGPAGPSGVPGVQGIRGPSGYNGTQGPPGPGASSCVFKTSASAGVTPFASAKQSVQVTESNDKTFIGVNCDTNDAKVSHLSSTAPGGKRTFKCECEGTLSTGVTKMFCNIHYWECQS